MARLITMNKALAVVLATLMGSFTEGLCHAAVIAQDDFESYTPGNTLIDQNGGTGWTGAWTGNIPTTLPTTHAVAGVLPGLGTSLELGTPGGDHRNMLLRSFAPQTGSFYVGYAFQTPVWFEHFFFQIYVNDFAEIYAAPTGSDINTSFSGGIANPAGLHHYYARKGSATVGVGTTADTGIAHTPDVLHTMVLRFSKSTGVATDIYDEVAVWIDQSTEGTPNAMANASDPGFATGTTPALGDTISALHFRMNAGPDDDDDRLYLDNLTVATTFAEAVPNVPTAHPGDFDGDGDVDGADFVAWQTNFPTASGAMLEDGDADGDGDVDGADFVVWQTNFPFTPGPGVAPVPEPTSACLALFGGAMALIYRRRHRQCN